LQGKISAYDFYSSIARKSDNTGTLNIKVCHNSACGGWDAELFARTDTSNSSSSSECGGI